jgi:hypothetical protein
MMHSNEVLRTRHDQINTPCFKEIELLCGVLHVCYFLGGWSGAWGDGICSLNHRLRGVDADYMVERC